MSQAAGGCLLAGFGIGALSAVFTASSDAGVALTVGGGWAAILWAAKRPNKIDNPSPPPPEPPPQSTNTQVTEIVQDPYNPHRWMVRNKKAGTK